MMIDINDIKNGMTVIIDGTLYQIVEFLHVKPGKGAAFMKIKLKNLKANTTLEKTFNTNIKIQKANITKMPMQYLYTTGDTYNFMNMETYEQVELPKEQIKDEIKYLKENLEVELVYFEEFETKTEALHREIELKKLTRAQKIELIKNVSCKK